MDERPFSLMLQPARRDGVGFIGLEMDDEAAWAKALNELRSAGVNVELGTPTEIALRAVANMAWALDPDGNRVEWYYGPRTALAPFKPGRPIGGFRTGELGFGHLAMLTPRLEAMEHFYFELIGFRLSDYMNSDVKARWSHINPRHHTLALVGGGERLLHHVMVEYEYVDDVGRLYDMALQIPERIQTTLGRHSNDHMLSFYSRTPGRFLIETGWGGRLIDEAHWQPEELARMSIWGHERHWQSAEMKRRLREQNDEASRQGIVYPVAVTSRSGFEIDR